MQRWIHILILIKRSNKEDPKFKVGDQVRISKYKNIFAKSLFPQWFEDILWLKNLQTLCCRHILLVVLTSKKVL